MAISQSSPANTRHTFSYRARNGAGEIVTGTMSAETADEVTSRLRTEGMYILLVEDKPLRSEVELDPIQVQRNEAAKRVRRDDVISFCQQLSVMIDTGVPLSEALDSFCKQTSRKEFREVLKVLRDDIHAGESLSSAMEKWPRVFPHLMVSLMKASEASGTMGMMLGRVGEYLSKERRTVKQVRGALSYPLFMMLAGVVMTIFLMVVVLPRFASIYAQRSASLPIPTKVLLGMSNFITTQYLYYGPALIVISVVLFLWFRHPSGRHFLDWLRLHIPLLRSMYSQLYITRATRTMGTLFNAGVSILDIIEICRGVTNNTYYDKLWDQMERDIRDGRLLSEAVLKASYIPSNIGSMIASGERSGQLPEVMEKIAAFSEEELESAVKQVTSYIEPIAIICMGIIVGGVAMALLLPIFSMGKVVSGGG